VSSTAISVEVNGRSYAEQVEPRLLLVDLIRHVLYLRGTHVGCEQGSCGACLVRVDGKLVRSCLMFAVAVDGCTIETVESLTPADGGLSPLQAAFREHHGLQCGFCTPGFLMAASDLLARVPSPTEAEIRDALGGNLCRCTGYAGIIAAVQHAATAMEDEE
jgi:aerobic carbon-monoxide dehydrogenase small subunit